MAEFINTIDLLGDDAVIDSIIDRTITEFKDDKITSIGAYAFYGCEMLETIEFPNVTSGLGEGAFRNCKSLKAITPNTFPKVTKQHYTYNEHIFQDCKSLESVSWPSLELLEAKSMFGGCSALKSVDLPNCDHAFYSDGMFNGCTSLTDVNLPKSTRIGGNYFQNCSELQYLKLPAVTIMVGGYTFMNCIKLRIVDFPSLTSITGSGSFDGCTALVALILRSPTVCTRSNSNFYYVTPSAIYNGDGYIYVPRALVEDYKVATNWSVLAAKFRALEDYTVDGTITGELDETKI